MTGRALPAALLASLLLWPAAAGGAEAGPASKATTSLRQTSERKLGSKPRPTVRERSSRRKSSLREQRVELQIPERLQKLLHRRIEARITRNLAAAKQLRREALGLLQKLVSELEDDSPEMPHALVRLAELEWEESRDRFLAAFSAWEQLPADKRGKPPSPSYARSRALLLRVLKNYKEFPDYDLALYVDGFLASEEGKAKQSLARFEKILAWFPKSRFVPDAHMVRAEFEFTKEVPDYENAYREYEQVLAFKDSDLHDLALFKSAWTLWRLGRRREAAERFLIVFRQTDEQATRAGARRSELQDLQAEALESLVTVFAEDEKNTADDMHQFLVQAGGEKFAARIVEALAEAFYDQAHYERGIEAYRLLLKLEPTSPGAFEHALEIARGHSTMEAWAELTKDYELAITRYTRPKKPGARPSVWVSAQDAATVREAERRIEAQLRSDAVGLHAKAQADKTSRAEYAAAAKLYATYLSRFDDGPEAYEMHFNRAEILFYHLGDPGASSDDYLAAVRLNPKGALSKDALFNALAALEQIRVKEFEARGKGSEGQSETETDKRLSAAMELYVKTYPDDPQVVELLFRQGKLYYDYGVYDSAVRQWGLLLEKYPKDPRAVPAGELILDSFNKSQDYENIETWARRLQKAPGFQNPTHQKRLRGLVVQAMFKRGEQLSERKQHDQAALAYLRAAQEFPTEERAAQAAVNAEIEAQRAGDLQTLRTAAALLVEHHKSRPEAATGVWIAATAHQAVGLFSEAGDYHATLVESWPRSKHHKDAAFNAVLLRSTIGEHEKAIESGQRFRRHYPRDPDADRVTFLMGKAHEKAGKWQEAEKLYADYGRRARSPSAKIEAQVLLARVRREQKQTRGVDAALSQAMKVYKAQKSALSDDGRYFAAQARYMQGERILADYEAVKIEGDVGQLKQRLRKKSELLKKAADAFLETAEIGVAEWTTAALYQIGFAYESFAKALLGSPPPDTLSAEEKELYAQAIDEFVIPIEERAIEAYESGWQKAIELGIFNQWTAKMRQALGRLNSELYPPIVEIGFELRSRAPTEWPELIAGLRRTEEGRSRQYLIPLKRTPAPASADAPAATPPSAPAEEKKP